MTPVPAAGFPKITNVVSRRSRPTARASARWSITAKTFTPFDPSRSVKPGHGVGDRAWAGLGDDAVVARGGTRRLCGIRVSGHDPARTRTDDLAYEAAARTGRAAWLSRQSLGRLAVPQRHPDADRHGRPEVVAALGTLDDPRPVSPLGDSWMVVLHPRTPARSPGTAPPYRPSRRTESRLPVQAKRSLSLRRGPRQLPPHARVTWLVPSLSVRHLPRRARHEGQVARDASAGRAMM